MSHLVSVSKAIRSRSIHPIRSRRTPRAPEPPVSSFDDDMTYEPIADQNMEPFEAFPSLPPSPIRNDLVTEIFPGAARVYGVGETFMDQFDNDVHADKRKDNLYYPFASKSDWEMASWLLRSGLSMPAIDEFLSLESTASLSLSFKTAKALRDLAEMLPPGPTWKFKEWSTSFPTKCPVTLYYRDPIDCLQSILSNPRFKDALDFTPLRIFETSEKLVRRYTEWLTGDTAWQMQAHLRPGATLLGTILSSDKTTISAITGNRVAHPLLISLANIKMDVRLKSSNHAYLLLALLPVPKFIGPKKQIGLYENRLLHDCLEYILKPLKTAAALGIMMSDPLGSRRFCFTPIAAYVADLQEALVIAGVCPKTSPLTMAAHTKLGDPFPHEPRTASTTLAQLQAIEDAIGTAAPIDEYEVEAKKFRLNGVHRPFWRHFPLSDPSVFLTPEPLHHWHKEFWDHDVKWCIKLLGSAEIDFRFSVLQTRTGYRHFGEGISKLKQVTGREHRDIQRYIVPIIAGAAPRDFVISIRALIDFRYRAQAKVLTDNDCDKILAALKEFHDHKQSILDARARVGKRGPIENWNIPKLELMQSVVRSIRANGVPIQYSADATEHANITEIKDPARHTNNRVYEPQICRNLDRLDKCQRFDLATSIREASISPSRACDELTEEDDVDSDPYAHIDSSPSRQPIDYFAKASQLLNQQHPNAPRPYRTFCNSSTSFNLHRDPSFKIMTVDEVAEKYGLSDLRSALADFVGKMKAGSLSSTTIGGRRKSPRDAVLPFDHLRVWTKLRVQQRSYNHPSEVLPAQTLVAIPPSQKYKYGQYDAVIVNIDPEQQWPTSGIKGHCVVELRVIFHPMLPETPQVIPGLKRFLSYAYRFDFVHQSSGEGRQGPHPDPATGMYLLKHSTRVDGTYLGDVLPVAQICAPADLVPHFGSKADPHLTKFNQRELCTEFWLNKTFDKEIYSIFDA